MAVDAAPGRDVIERAGIGAGDFENIASLQFIHLVLGFYHRHRAQRVAGIECVLAHVKYTIPALSRKAASVLCQKFFLCRLAQLF